MSGRDEYIANMKRQLDEWKVTMGKLEAKAQQAAEDTRDKYTAETSKLRQQSQLDIDKFDEHQAAGKDS